MRPRAVRTTVGAWDVLRSKLLPLAEQSGNDLVATRTLCKIFVLTHASVREVSSSIGRAAGPRQR